MAFCSYCSCEVIIYLSLYYHDQFVGTGKKKRGRAAATALKNI